VSRALGGPGSSFHRRRRGFALRRRRTRQLRRRAARDRPPIAAALQNLPDIVARAATRVRAAKSRGEAVKAIKMAIVEVHKSIALLKADDPIAL
jgi:hypothetical protein